MWAAWPYSGHNCGQFLYILCKHLITWVNNYFHYCFWTFLCTVAGVSPRVLSGLTYVVPVKKKEKYSRVTFLFTAVIYIFSCITACTASQCSFSRKHLYHLPEVIHSIVLNSRQYILSTEGWCPWVSSLSGHLWNNVKWNHMPTAQATSSPVN